MISLYETVLLTGKLLLRKGHYSFKKLSIKFSSILPALLTFSKVNFTSPLLYNEGKHQLHP
jgi:hypothetical protein